MKKIIVSDNCVACGSCILGTVLLEEKSNGKAAPVNAAVVAEEQLEEIQKIISACPVQAISLVEASLTKAKGKDGLNELKEIIDCRLGNYKVQFPKAEDYAFNKECYYIPAPGGSGEYRYDYRSDGKATDAGLREFDRIMYSQIKPIVQNVLIDYKNKMLRKFFVYERTEDNFYYNVNQNIDKIWQEIVAEAITLTSATINLPDSFDCFEVIPQFGISGDSFNKELYIYRLKHIEETFLSKTVTDKLKGAYPLSDYGFKIDTDNREIYKSNGRYDRDVYCYCNVHNACVELAKDILNHIDWAIGLDYDPKDEIESLLKYFVEAVQKELKSKVGELLRAIDSIG